MHPFDHPSSEMKARMDTWYGEGTSGTK